MKQSGLMSIMSTFLPCMQALMRQCRTLDDLSQVLHGSDRLNDQFVERLIYSMYVQCYKWLTEYDVAHQLLTRVLELGHP
jgi:hypothetical protein